MIMLRCEKESVRPDHVGLRIHVTALRCEKEPVKPDHVG